MATRSNALRTLITVLLTAVVVSGLFVSIPGSPVSHFLSTNHALESPFGSSTHSSQAAPLSPAQDGVNASVTVSVPNATSNQPYTYRIIETYHPKRTNQPGDFAIYTLAKWDYNVTNISIQNGSLSHNNTLATWNSEGPLTISATLHAAPARTRIYPSGGANPALIATRHGVFISAHIIPPYDTIQNGYGVVSRHFHAAPHTHVTRAGYGWYFGPAKTYSTRTRGNETIRLVIPRDSSHQYLPPESALLKAYRTEGRLLTVGHRPSTVTVFVTPPPLTHRLKVVKGLTVNSTIFTYSGGANRLNYSRSTWEQAAFVTWLHEYVHTRQPPLRAYGPQMKWFNEADAQFYAATVARQEGLVSNTTMIADLQYRYSNRTAPLANKSAWPYPTYQYFRGPRVLAVLNSQLRRQSNGHVTLMTVQRQLTKKAANGTTITLPVFTRTLEDYLPPRVVRRDVHAYITGANPAHVPTTSEYYVLSTHPVNTTSPGQRTQNQTQSTPGHQSRVLSPPARYRSQVKRA